MTPVDVCNIALSELGNRVNINSLSDATPAAQQCRVFYTPKVQALLRAANWDFCRAQLPLTQWKAAVINGQLSPNPPPQPWLYSYLYPTDCLKMRFIQPTVATMPLTPPLTTSNGGVFIYPGVPTSIPFVSATDFDPSGNPIRVILTNVFQAQGIYTRDLSQVPDLWDALFLSGATALLASYLIPALSLDKGQMQLQIGLTKSAIDQARSANANESISNVDHNPDWMRARTFGGMPWTSGAFTNAPGGFGVSGAGWDSCGLPSGEFY